MEMVSCEGIEAMKRKARRLQTWIHARGTKVGHIHQWSKCLIILPALALFCLAVTSCDVPENEPPVIAEPMDQASEDVSAPSPTATLSNLEAQVGAATNGSFPKIVAFGNSLTAGLGVGPDESYPGQLERWLRKKGFQYEVINAGVSGETSAGGVRRVEWILRSQPKVVILELGANDGLRGQPLYQTYENLKAIIERIQTEGVVVILAGMQIPLNYGEDYTEEFSGMYGRLAKELEAPLIPFLLEGVATHPDLNQGDGLHPNAAGYQIVVQNVWKTLKPILLNLAALSPNKNTHDASL